MVKEQNGSPREEGQETKLGEQEAVRKVRRLAPSLRATGVLSVRDERGVDPAGL